MSRVNGYLYKLILFWSAIFSIGGTVANESVFLPNVEDDADKLRFLLSINRQAPEVFLGGIYGYDVDLYSVLKYQSNIQESLQKDPAYLEAWNKKELLDLTFNVKTSDNIALSAGHVMAIKEQNPHTSIFKGLVESKYSELLSPAPNDPNERIFFVYNEKNKFRGVISSTMTKNTKGEPCLFVRSFLDNNGGEIIDKHEADLVMQGLYENKKLFGVEKIIVPIDDEVNVFTSSSENTPSQKFQFWDEKMREKVEKFDQVYARNDYLEEGVEYLPQAKTKIKIQTTATTLPSKARSLHVNKTYETTEVLDLIHQVFLSGINRKGILDTAFKDPIKRKAAEDFMRLRAIGYTDDFFASTTGDLSKKIDELINILEISPEGFKEKKSKWFINGWLGVSDGREKENLAKNLERLTWDLETNDPPLTNTGNFSRYQDNFRRSPEYSRLRKLFLEKLQSDENFAKQMVRQTTNDPRFWFLFAEEIPDELLPSGRIIVQLQKNFLTLSEKGRKLVEKDLGKLTSTEYFKAIELQRKIQPDNTKKLFAMFDIWLKQTSLEDMTRLDQLLDNFKSLSKDILTHIEKYLTQTGGPFDLQKIVLLLSELQRDSLFFQDQSSSLSSFLIKIFNHPSAYELRPKILEMMYGVVVPPEQYRAIVEKALSDKSVRVREKALLLASRDKSIGDNLKIARMTLMRKENAEVHETIVQMVFGILGKRGEKHNLVLVAIEDLEKRIKENDQNAIDRLMLICNEDSHPEVLQKVYDLGNKQLNEKLKLPERLYEFKQRELIRAGLRCVLNQE